VTLFVSPVDIAGELALLLRATVLMAAGWAGAAGLRRAGASAAARHMAWFLSIAALLALPILWWLAPALRLPILPAEAATAAAASPPFALTAPMPPDAAVQAGWGPILAFAYALGAAALVVRLIIGRLMLTRLWRDSGPVPDPAWDDLLSRLSIQMKLSRRVELRMSSAPAVPMTWGTLAPKVLLPAEACEWPPERRKLVLLHELAHVARCDSLSRSLASLACALYWFHPGAWFAARRMRLEQEHAADDRVLMAGGSAKAYALSLLHLARGPGARPRFDQAAAMAGMYQLERRLVSITHPGPRNRPGTVFLSSSALLAGLTTLLVAAGVPVSASTTHLEPVNARASDRATAAGRNADVQRAEFPLAQTENGIEQLPRESVVALEGRPRRRAPQSAAEGRPARRASSLPVESEPAGSGAGQSEDGPQSTALAQPLRNYGWELPRPEPTVQLGSPGGSPQPTRVTLPKPIHSASNQRIGRPKWARNLPRLARGSSPMGSPASTSPGPLMLSWPLRAGAK
jgi:beta-lactamase regulating signal transducer with metallopeptidase domain